MRFIKKLETYPIGTCGAALAFIVLANCWSINGINFLKPLAFIVSIVAILIKILRIIYHYEIVKCEVKDPSLGCLYPTIDMTCFLIAGSSLKLYPNFSKELWIVIYFIYIF